MASRSRLLPTTQNISWDRTGSPPTLSDILITVIEDVEVLYIQFYFQFENTSVNWLDAPGLDTSYIPYNGNSTSLPLALQNLEFLPAGNYKATVFIEFSNSEGYTNTLTSIVNLNLSGQIGIKTDKSTYNLVFNRATNILSGDTTVNILNNTENKLLSFWQPVQIFTPKNNFTDSFELDSGGFANNPDVPESGTVNNQYRIFGPSNEFITAFDINLLVLNDNGFGVNPDSYYFEVIKNTTEKTGILNIINPNNLEFTIEKPDWLIISSSSGNSTMDINIATNTSSIPPAIYEDFIIVSYNGGTISIPVTLNLKQFITFDDSDNDFCLDIQPVKFSKIKELANSVKITMKATYVVMGVTTIVNQIFSIPYINDKASFDLGKKLHNYFPRYRNHLFEISNTIEFMKAIDCELILEEIDVNNSSLMSETVSGIKLYPGSIPAMYPVFTNYGFRKKNKGTVAFISHRTSNSVLLEKIVNPADTLNYGGSNINIYPLPDSFRPVHMHWENQNLVPDWFTFTGDYSINLDFTHIASKNVLKSLMQKFDTTKIKKLNINTGFMIKNEVEMLEEMIMNRLVFFKIGSKIYEAYNVTPKLIFESSSETIIERDLEFIIVEK